MTGRPGAWRTGIASPGCAHLIAAHPHVTALPDGYRKAWGSAAPVLAFAFHGSGPGRSDRVGAAVTSVHRVPPDRPARSAEERRELVEQHGLPVEPFVDGEAR